MARCIYITGRNVQRIIRECSDEYGNQAVYKWQHGVAMPTPDNLVVLAAVFGVSMDEIIAVDVNAKAQISA